MRVVTLSSYTIALLLIVDAYAFAHPGPVDSCVGHTVTDRQDVGQDVMGDPLRPLEPGEYHFHFTPEQMNHEVLPSLALYRAQVRASGGDPRDLGTFTAGGHAYDILEYTRQGDAILHCHGEEDITKTGIGRIQVAP